MVKSGIKHIKQANKQTNLYMNVRFEWVIVAQHQMNNFSVIPWRQKVRFQGDYDDDNRHIDRVKITW
jgi:hypothetical protein